MRLLTGIVAFAVAASASACFWDRDTLVDEAKEFPTVLNAIVGRFERNPPLYYQVRLERVRQEIANDPSRLDLYDDAGVAASRLGHQDEAIDWMEKKRKAMDPDIDPDVRYRTESNEGTFKFLAWMASDHKNPKLLDEAIAEIQAGLNINPHAHFDRERYQLAFMKWLRGARSAPLVEDLPWNGQNARDVNSRDAQVKGLVGLIVLGPAWESPDVLNALGGTLAVYPGEYVSLGYFAFLRRDELLAAGVMAFYDDLASKLEESTLDQADRPYVEGEYKRLRKEADDYASARQSFMVERLRVGRHPDTDPAFWDGWVEPPAPEVQPMSFWHRNFAVASRPGPGLIALLFLVFPGIPIVLSSWFVIRAVRRHFKTRPRTRL